eukprot:10917292-Heterocapsa_arctica.AAC.2
MAKIGKYDYPTVFTNSALDSFLSTEYGKLASYRKGLRWSLMTAIRLFEPERCSSLPSFDNSDAKWIAGLYQHQSRCGTQGLCPAVLFKVAIDHLSDSCFPTIDEASDPNKQKAEKARTTKDRARITNLLGSRPFP